MTSAKTNDIFKKLKFPRIESNVPGVDVEVRDDEEQLVKLNEIIDILVNAGYFRAKIKGLSPFDKVVGGMTWCIESCNVDVDVDILFQENSTIGQKIALTEKIVAVLPQLKCPHQLEPHQIQGLDFIHIYPVVQWLVKRSMEFRQEIFEYVFSYAVSQYDKSFTEPKVLSEKEKNIVDNLKKVNDKYMPERSLKKIKALDSADIKDEINFTLMEFGEMDIYKNNDRPNKKITELFGKQSNTDIANESDQFLDSYYKSLSRQFKIGEEKITEEMRITSMKEQSALLSDRINQLENERLKTDEKIVIAEDNLADLKLKEEEAIKRLNSISQLNEEDEKIKEVEELVKTLDKLKKEEADFYEHCKEEKAKLMNMIKEAQNLNQEVSNDDIEKVIKQYTEENEKLKPIRLRLAKRNRAIAILQRQLDDVPSHAELAQYQRRFLELYNQISAKHKETKQYYTFHNSLQDIKFYMEKELSILNSIAENYVEAMMSKSGREQFLQQFEQILSGVNTSKKRLEMKLEGEKKKKSELNHELQCLLDLQRKYVAAVKELSIECQKHEALLSK